MIANRVKGMLGIKIMCPRCHRMPINCSFCDGLGSVSYNKAYPPTPNGKKKCPMCDGWGADGMGQTCPMCRGDRFVPIALTEKMWIDDNWRETHG